LSHEGGEGRSRSFPVLPTPSGFNYFRLPSTSPARPAQASSIKRQDKENTERNIFAEKRKKKVATFVNIFAQETLVVVVVVKDEDELFLLGRIIQRSCLLFVVVVVC